MQTFHEKTQLINEFLQECYPDGIMVYKLKRNEKRWKIGFFQQFKTPKIKEMFHLSRIYEIIFEPIKYTCIYFDDPQNTEKLQEIPCAHWVAITSPGRVQVHIPIPPILRKTYQDSITERKILQRCCHDFFQTENVAAWNHCRKLPLMQNPKYNPPTIIHIEKRNPENTHFDYFLRFLELLNETYQRIKPLYQENTPSPRNIQNRTRKQKCWTDFYTGDESVADIRYAVYLFSRGYSWAEVENALLLESHNIAQRKKGHLKDYLNRTLQKAYAHAVSTWNPPQKKD